MVPLLTLLVNHFLAGSIPAAIRGVVLGATLLAFQKPGGGIRPIAIGETLRRLTSKLAARCMSDVAKSLTPQLGVGVPGGVEVAVHATRAHALEHPDHVILRVDFRNAFNSVDRAAVFEATLEHAPALYHWVASCYSGPTTLFTWARPIPSSQGVPQGDPLSPLLFCLVLHALTERITECKPSLQWWFLDDGVIAGPPEVIARVVQTIRVVAPGLGLHLSMAKSDLRLSPSTVLPPSLSGFSRGPLHAFITLGAPIGPPDYCTEVISAKVDKSRRLLTALGKCPDPQIGLSLLRHCGSFCRMAFFTRTVSPSHCSVPFQVFDSLVMATLSALIGSALPPDAQLLASLPLKKGGMGLLSSSRLHALGYASSIASSRKAFHALYTKAGSTPPSMVAPLAQARLALVSALPAGATRPFPDPLGKILSQATYTTSRWTPSLAEEIPADGSFYSPRGRVTRAPSSPTLPTPSTTSHRATSSASSASASTSPSTPPRATACTALTGRTCVAIIPSNARVGGTGYNGITVSEMPSFPSSGGPASALSWRRVFRPRTTGATLPAPAMFWYTNGTTTVIGTSTWPSPTSTTTACPSPHTTTGVTWSLQRPGRLAVTAPYSNAAPPTSPPTRAMLLSSWTLQVHGVPRPAVCSIILLSASAAARNAALVRPAMR